MRALEIHALTGPATALRLVERPEPPADHPATPGRGVLIDVHAAGVSYPEVLQSRGEYQLKPDVPFVPGGEVAGTVREAPADSGFAPGDRVAAYCVLGGFAEVVAAPEHLTVRLPGALDFAQGAGLVLNYHTAYFALHNRGRLRPGEWVLVHGASGGIGTAALQIASGLGARTIAVVSSEAKATIATTAGAEHVVLTSDDWKTQVRELSGAGVDLILDPVGGDRFTDSLRSLREDGRVVVVGFAGGSIPEVRVNRLLLANTEVVGAGWGAYVLKRPRVSAEIASGVRRLVESGHVAPIVGHRLPLERGSDALRCIDERRATGKVVLEVR